MSGELRILDRSEELLAEFDRAELRPCDPGAVRIAAPQSGGPPIRYRVAGGEVFVRCAPHPGRGTGDESPGTWLVYGSEGDFGVELTETLRQQGHHVVVAEATGTSAQASHASGLDSRRYVVDPTRPEDVAALVSDLASNAPASTGQASTGQASTGQASTGQASTGQASTGQASTGQASTGQASTGQPGSAWPPFRGVLFIGMPATGASELWLDSVDRSCGGLLHLVQALVEHKDDTRARLWIVTRGPSRSGPKGLRLRGARSSLGPRSGDRGGHPEVWGGMIDLEHERRAEDVSHVLAEVHASDSGSPGRLPPGYPLRASSGPPNGRCGR